MKGAWSIAQENKWMASFALVLGAILCLSAITAYDKIVSVLDRNHEPPVIIYSATFDKDVAKPGDSVTLVVNGMRIRHCPAEVTSFWMDENGAVVQNELLSASPNTKTGPYIGKYVKHIPYALTHGMWSYTAHMTYNCSDGKYIVRQDPVSLWVVE